MAKVKEKKELTKEGVIANFVLVGEAKIGEYTYKTNERSEKSDWIYNHLNLGVYCGEAFGTVYAELMGGFGAERENVVYVHGKDKDGKDDFKNKFQIDWDDRFDDDLLEEVGDLCFYTVGLEKDKNKKVFYKKFLTPYDVIDYVKENLEDGMVINVKGNIKYSIYEGATQVKKEISSIVLSKVDDPSKYYARFTQTMLLTKDSIGKPEKGSNVLPINAKVLDYVKEYNGHEVKCIIPFDKEFEYEYPENPEIAKKIIDKLFVVKKGVTEATFEGDLIESGASVKVTIDDIPDDIKELIEMGLYTEEEAIERCSTNEGRSKRMVIRKPKIKMVDIGGEKKPEILRTEKKYEEEDLILDFMYHNDTEEDESDVEADENEDVPLDTNESSEEQVEDWMKQILG